MRSAEVARRFHDAHRARYGYDVPARSGRSGQRTLTATGSVSRVAPGRSARESGAAARRRRRCRSATSVWLDDAFVDVPVFERDALASGARIEGPAIVEAYDSTAYVAPRWSLAVDDDLLVLQRDRPALVTDPITIEVIKNALVYASEEMGIAVRNAAYSPNIKERLDHSCALFDRFGRLIAQAEHIPVHLGSLPWGLQRMLAVVEREYGGVREGEMWVANDPYITGTHLNDVTLVRPIFFHGPARRICREQGAPRRRRRLRAGLDAGRRDRSLRRRTRRSAAAPRRATIASLDEVVALFRANSRTPEARSGDLRAQVAGNYTGERRLRELYERYGFETLEAAIARALDDSERRMRAALRVDRRRSLRSARLSRRSRRRRRDIGIALRLELRDGERSARLRRNLRQLGFPLNAVFGVTLSGVHYALRAVTDPTIPMNDGCFRPVEVRVPEGSLLNPRRPAPVSGGNVETSMRNADVVLQALAQAAPAARSGVQRRNDEQRDARRNAPGRPNLGLLRNERLRHGRAPERRRHRRDSLSHDQHAEHADRSDRTRVSAARRALRDRAGTGGAGRYRGGNGLVRSIELTEGAAQATLLADRQTLAPPGAQGGERRCLRTSHVDASRHRDAAARESEPAARARRRA